MVLERNVQSADFVTVLAVLNEMVEHISNSLPLLKTATAMLLQREGSALRVLSGIEVNV